MKAIDWANMYSRMPRTTADSSMSILLKHFPYRVNLKIGPRQKEIDEWIVENFTYDCCVQIASVFFFADDSVAMQFKLTWYEP